MQSVDHSLGTQSMAGVRLGIKEQFRVGDVVSLRAPRDDHASGLQGVERRLEMRDVGQHEVPAGKVHQEPVVTDEAVLVTDGSQPGVDVLNDHRLGGALRDEGYFRSLSGTDNAGGFGVDFGTFHYWQGTVGVTFKFGSM